MAKDVKVGDLRRQIYQEAKGEFDAVLGNGVKKDDEKNNQEAYSDTAKRVKEYLKGLDNEAAKVDKSVAGGENRDMSSLLYDRVNDSFKARVAAQLKGYDSVEAEKEHKDEELGNAERGDKSDVEFRKDKADAVKTDKDTLKTIGLTGHNQDKKEVEKQTSTMYEKKDYTRLRFKHTKFLSENDMKKHIPDKYKVEGKRFYMTDNAGNDYLVEWACGVADVINSKNEIQANESYNRIKDLMKYDSHVDYQVSDINLRESADGGMIDVLNKTRQIVK